MFQKETGSFISFECIVVCRYLEEQFISAYYGGLTYHQRETELRQMLYESFEVLLPPSLIVVDENRTVNVPHRIIKRPVTTCKLFCGEEDGSEIVTICSSFYFPHQGNDGISFVAAHTTYIYTVVELQCIALT